MWILKNLKRFETSRLENVTCSIEKSDNNLFKRRKLKSNVKSSSFSCLFLPVKLSIKGAHKKWINDK